MHRKKQEPFRATLKHVGKTYCVGVVAQSVEPWIPEKIGGRAWVRVPPTPIKRCLFFMGISPHHANGETVSFSYPIQYFGSGALGMWQNRVYGKTLVRELRFV